MASLFAVFVRGEGYGAAEGVAGLPEDRVDFVWGDLGLIYHGVYMISFSVAIINNIILPMHQATDYNTIHKHTKISVGFGKQSQRITKKRDC